MTTLLEVRDLSVSYGKVEAVHKVSITVDEGTIVTVIGPNGAGKTTLLAAIMGTLASKGDIRYQGRRRTGARAREARSVRVDDGSRQPGAGRIRAGAPR